MSDRSGIHGWTIRVVDSTGSTNADLLADLEAGRAGAKHALRTDHQSAGRGRLDRRWDAPSGENLLVSLAFLDVPVHPATLTQAVGIAAVHAVDAVVGERLDGRLMLKWPNDVLLDDRKLAGVLAQRAASGAVVVGIGVNVGWSPDTASSLSATLGLAVQPATLLDELLGALDEHLALTDEERHGRYAARLGTLGRVVRVQLPAANDLVGVAEAVERDGRLVVRSHDGQRHVIDVGDIVHLRTPENDQP
ncbi:MAG: biotin--[acetyl-CoA-carboxylase] ligase [Ilumatobacter sp.]